MPVHVPAALQPYSLPNTKEPTFISTGEALMKQEADLSRGMALGCFYSNLCKWAYLHYAGFLCEAGSCHSTGPWGPRVEFAVFLRLKLTEVCEKTKKETGVRVEACAGGSLRPSHTTQCIVHCTSTTVGIGMVMGDQGYVAMDESLCWAQLS